MTLPPYPALSSKYTPATAPGLNIQRVLPAPVHSPGQTTDLKSRLTIRPAPSTMRPIRNIMLM